MPTAFISLGSNLGDKLGHCQNAVDALKKFCRVLAQSAFYKTEPVDYTDQDWFVNAVVQVETALNPHELLACLNTIEKKAGRDRENSVRFGPRTLDMDILLYDDFILTSSTLVLPHPRMHKRRFVLQPLCDIDPTIIHPLLRKNMNSLLNSLKDDGQEIVLLVKNKHDGVFNA